MNILSEWRETTMHVGIIKNSKNTSSWHRNDKRISPCTWK